MVWPKHLSSDMFSVWEQLSSDKMMIFSGGLASYLYMILWNIWEGEGCSLSHQQDLQTVCSDFPSIPKSSVKFLWFNMTHRNVFLATQRPWSQNRDCGGRGGVPNVFQSTSRSGRYVETLWSFRSVASFAIWLIGVYFWPPEGLSLGLGVAKWVFQMCSKQSASGFRRWIETQWSYRFRWFCGLALA